MPKTSDVHYLSASLVYTHFPTSVKAGSRRVCSSLVSEALHPPPLQVVIVLKTYNIASRVAVTSLG